MPDPSPTPGGTGARAAHTPDPWTLDAEDWTIRSRAFGQSDMMGNYRGVIVADLTPAHGGRPHAYAEARANAALLAAAPLLLAACEDVIVSELSGTIELHTLLRNELRAAIAAARGE